MGRVEGVFEVYYVACIFFVKGCNGQTVAYEHTDIKIDAKIFSSELLYPIPVNPCGTHPQSQIACFGFPRGAN